MNISDSSIFSTNANLRTAGCFEKFETSASMALNCAYIHCRSEEFKSYVNMAHSPIKKIHI